MQMSSQNSALFIKSSNTSLQLLLQPMTMLGMLLQHEKKKKTVFTNSPSVSSLRMYF